MSETCDLCGLPLPRNPVLRQESAPGQAGEARQFCCEGCARVYEVARESGMLEEVLGRMRPIAPAETLPAPRPFQPNENAIFDIEGMWCAGCALAAERVLSRQPGVKDVSVSFAAGSGRIEFDPARVDPAALLRQLEPLGYSTRVTSSHEERQKERFQNRIGLQLMAAIAFGMEVMVLYLVQLYPEYALGHYNAPDVRRIQYLVWAMTTPVVFYGGLTFLTGAWRSLRAGTVGMDTLVALGVLSAYLYSAYVTVTGAGQTYFDSAAMIVDFILIGRYLEAAGGAQARKDLRSLLKLQPDLAWVRAEEPGAGAGPDDGIPAVTGQAPGITEGGWRQVRVEELTSGTQILIKPGERVPADAAVREGEATLDESLLTGESMPVTKRPGDTIYAGTIIREGALIGLVTGPPGSTRLARIAELVNQTLAQKPRIQRLADQSSTYFTYAILLLALGTLVGWYLKTSAWPAALLAAVAVLVVACPCALGLATPLAMTVMMGRAARRGILVRIPEVLETATGIQRVVFDKTGTLTLGRLAVTRVIPSTGVSLTGEDVLGLAAAVEQFSEHPLGKAILQHAQRTIPRAFRDEMAAVKEFISLRGSGVSARVGPESGQRILVGSTRLVDPSRDRDLQAQAAEHAAQGETVVWVAREEQVVGLITLRDQLNPSAGEAIARLAARGIDSVMLSGDTPQAAEAIARELGLAVYEGSCSPEDKAARLAGWQRQGLRVGMVGDGVNDAPALAQASLSITTAGGADIAGQASDLVLTRSDLRLVPWFLQLSRQTRRTILQNLGWAFAYNLITIPLAVLGLITPVIAAAAMAVSSLLVVVNSLRIRQV